jgi:hypothetical protein
MIITCAYCGTILNDHERYLAIENNMPGACEKHETMVYEEAQSESSMWPSDWHGHNSQNNDGAWHELPSDDGDYDIVE